MKREKKILAYTAATILLWGAGGVLAFAQQQQGGFVPLVSIPGVQAGKVDLAGFFNSLFRLFIAAAAAIAIVRIVWAGFKYMTVESIRDKGESREKILDALIGLLLALGTFMLLSIINPNLTNIGGGVTRVEIKGDDFAVATPESVRNQVKDSAEEARKKPGVPLEIKDRSGVPIGTFTAKTDGATTFEPKRGAAFASEKAFEDTCTEKGGTVTSSRTTSVKSALDVAKNVGYKFIDYTAPLNYAFNLNLAPVGSDQPTGNILTCTPKK